MTPPTDASLLNHFAQLKDPRDERGNAQLLIDIISIAIWAVIGGAGSWTAIEAYGHAKISWLQTFLRLPNGIPAHDTLTRLFARLELEQRQEGFVSWSAAIGQLTQGDIIAIDGKTVRGFYNARNGKGASLG